MDIKKAFEQLGIEYDETLDTKTLQLQGMTALINKMEDAKNERFIEEYRRRHPEV